MPTNTNAYNSRVTDEALEKRFRDTFRSQGGAELVDDLYAQGVIVPVVDFTQAATGDVLAQNLQTAWDFSTGNAQINNTTTTIISNAGFWQVDLTVAIYDLDQPTVIPMATLSIFDGTTSKPIWGISSSAVGVTSDSESVADNSFVVFLRSGDSLRGFSGTIGSTLDVWYRQIATVNGDLVNPTGFTSS